MTRPGDMINKRLARIAGTDAAIFRKTTSRVEELLDQNGRKFHESEDQLKSRQLAESKVIKLESEIEEPKRKYKNIEKRNPTAELE